MKKKDYSLNGENADEICAKIKEEADEEVEFVLEKASKEKERILSEAAKDTREKSSAILAKTDREIERISEKIFSTVNIEKKRTVLDEKNRFIQDVFSAVREKAGNFHKDKSYPEFLKKAILEGLDVVDVPHTEIFYSFIDDDIVNNEFIKDIENSAQARARKDISINFKREDFKDIGVIVQSQDGRLFFDNRFSARLKRIYDDLYMELLKEAF